MKSFYRTYIFYYSFFIKFKQLSYSAKITHKGKMSIDLFANIQVGNKMIADFAGYIIKSQRHNIGLSPFKHILENSIMFGPDIKHTDITPTARQGPLKLLFIRNAAHNNNLIESNSSIQLISPLNKSPYQFGSQTIPNNVNKLERKQLMNDIGQVMTCFY